MYEPQSRFHTWRFMMDVAYMRFFTGDRTSFILVIPTMSDLTLTSIASILLVGMNTNMRARIVLFSGVRADFVYVVQVGEAVYRSLAFSTRVCLSETLFCT